MEEKQGHGLMARACSCGCAVQSMFTDAQAKMVGWTVEGEAWWCPVCSGDRRPLDAPQRALSPAVECAAGRAAGLLVEFFCAVQAGHWHGAVALHKILGDVGRQLGGHMGEQKKKRRRGHDLSVSRGGRRHPGTCGGSR